MKPALEALLHDLTALRTRAARGGFDTAKIDTLRQRIQTRLLDLIAPSPAPAMPSRSLEHRSAALRVIADVTGQYERPCTSADLCARGHILAVAAQREIHNLVADGLCERDGRGVWLTEDGMEAVLRDRPRSVPGHVLALASEIEDA